MNRYIKNSLFKYIGVLIGAIAMLSVLIAYYLKDDYFKDITNTCRVLVSNQLNNIIEKKEDRINPYNYSIIDLTGSVVESSEGRVGERVSISKLSFNSFEEDKVNRIIRYFAPYQNNGEIDGIIIFSIPIEDILDFRSDIKSKVSILLIVFFILLIVFILYRIYKLILKDVLLPVSEMHRSAKEILRGNYLSKVSYDYEGEVGEFSHDFEKMRDELMEASKREKELKKAEKELLAYISHDLKTPISNILGYCEGIRDGVVKEEKDIKRYVSIIINKSKLLNKLLDDILELSKAEINQMTIKKHEVYSKEFFEELLEEISMDVYSSGRSFEVNNSIPNIILNIDEDKITQVLNNIIGNSIKYTREGGKITVAFRKILGGIEVRVKDDGIGIASDELSLVFNKFYRSEKHRNQNIPGSGLGLSISKYIVEAHNGSIEIFSNRNEGTTVIFTIRGE